MDFQKEIVFLWKTNQSFKRHVADMKQFREDHINNPASNCYVFGNMPTPGSFQSANTSGGSKILISPSRKSTLVPLWRVELPKGLQN